MAVFRFIESMVVILRILRVQLNELNLYAILADLVSHWAHAFPNQDSLSWVLGGVALFYFWAARSWA
jgi:hypothetical protein